MNTLQAKVRNMVTTRAKRLRREGYVTGNLFSKEIEGSIPLIIERKEAERGLKTCYVGSQVTVDVEGKTYKAIIKELDYNSMTRQMLEVDFQGLVSGEKVHSVAEVILKNKEVIVNGIVEQLIEEVAYKALPEDLIDKIELDVSSLRIGHSIKVKDLEIAKNKNIDIQTNMDATIVNVVAPKAEIVEDEETSTTAK